MVRRTKVIQTHGPYGVLMIPKEGEKTLLIRRGPAKADNKVVLNLTIQI